MLDTHLEQPLLRLFYNSLRKRFAKGVVLASKHFQTLEVLRLSRQKGVKKGSKKGSAENGTKLRPISTSFRPLVFAKSSPR